MGLKSNEKTVDALEITLVLKAQRTRQKRSGKTGSQMIREFAVGLMPEATPIRFTSMATQM